MTRLIPILLACLALAACKKDNEKPSLVGKWMRTAWFDDRPGVGCNCWVEVDKFIGQRFEFNRDNTYNQYPGMISSMMMCPGTYQVLNDTTLRLTTICWGGAAPVDYDHTIEKQGSMFTIDYTGPYSKTKMRFKKVRSFY